MNTSRVIFIAGFAIAFGFYVTNTSEADTRAVSVAEQRFSQMQAELIANTGIWIASNYMATWKSGDGLSMSNRTVHNGKMSYSIAYDSYVDPDHAVVTATGTFKGVTVRQIGYLAKNPAASSYWLRRTQWYVEKLYTEPYRPTE